MESRPKTVISLDTSKLQRRPHHHHHHHDHHGHTHTHTHTGSHGAERAAFADDHDRHNSDAHGKEYIAAVDETGELIGDGGSAIRQRKLVIPIPALPDTHTLTHAAPAAATQTAPATAGAPEPVPPVAVETAAGVAARDDVAAAPQTSIAGDANGIISSVAQAHTHAHTHTHSHTHVRPRGEDRSDGGGDAGAASAVHAGMRRRRDDDRGDMSSLRASLFKPSQKRVRGDGQSAPLLLRARALAQGHGPGEDVDASTFERIPIDEFGAAMLRGMGAEEHVLAAALGTGAGAAGGSAGAAVVPPPDAPRDKDAKRFGIGARDTEEAAAMRQMDREARDAHRIRKPGEKVVTPGLAAVAAVPGSAAPEPKVSRAELIRQRKYPGVVEGACVRVLRGALQIRGHTIDGTGVLGILTQMENVPGLERCKIRVRVPEHAHHADAFLAPADAPAEPGAQAVAATEVIIVPKTDVQAVLNPDGSVFNSATLSADETEAAAFLRIAHAHEQAQAARRAAAAAAAATKAAAEKAQAEAEEKAAKAERQDAPLGSETNAHDGVKHVDHANVWLRPGIRVRVIDKSALGERYYLKKAVVIAVNSDQTRCTISIARDDGSEKVVDDMRARELETALPKSGGPVVVVRGKLQGSRGTLVERRAEAGVAVIRLLDGSTRGVAFDDVAEWVDMHAKR